MSCSEVRSAKQVNQLKVAAGSSIIGALVILEEMLKSAGPAKLKKMLTSPQLIIKYLLHTTLTLLYVCVCLVVTVVIAVYLCLPSSDCSHCCMFVCVF